MGKYYKQKNAIRTKKLKTRQTNIKPAPGLAIKTRASPTINC